MLCFAFLQLAPAYEGVELGIGDSLLMKALQGASGRTNAEVREKQQHSFWAFSRRM